MHSNKILLLLLFALFCFISISFIKCSKETKQDEDIVARIGSNYVFTFNDLREYVFDWDYNKKYRDKSEAYNLALESMVTNQLKRIDFFAKGLNKDEKLIQSIRRIIKEEVVIEYFNTQYLSKYTNDDYAKKIYSIMDKRVIYRQIFLKLPENASAKQKESLRKKAVEIKDEIIEGKDFGQLVNQYSQDTLSINSNGYMQPLGWEQSLTDPIGNLIFNFKAGDVHVLDSGDGFYIVKVVEVSKIEVKPFEKIKNELINKLKNIYSDKSLEEFENDKKKSVDENSIKWDNKALTQLINWSEIPGFYYKIYNDTLQNAISRNNFTILTYSNGQVDLKEYLHLLNDVLIPRFSEKVKEENIKAYIVEAMQTDKVIKKAEELGIENKIFNVQTKNPVLKHQIAVLYNQAVIDSQIPKPTDEILHKFYNEQKDSLYYQLHKINVYAMIFPDENQAEEVMRKIKAGTPFEKISGRWLVKTFIRDREGNIKTYLSTEEPFLGEAAFKLNLDETTGPVEYFEPGKGQQYAIIKCINIRPEKQLLFDDVKKSIAEDYRKYKREIMMKEVRDKLWEKYDVEIYNDVLEKKLANGN